MAQNLLLSVHGCVCLSLIKLSMLARSKPVDFLFPCYIHEGAPAAVLDEEGSFIWVLRLFPGGVVLLWGCPWAWKDSGLGHDVLVL